MLFNHFVKPTLLLLVVIISLCACQKDNELTTNLLDTSSTTRTNFSEETFTILPLGDSRVEGNRPDYESYRYELWKRFIENDIPVDFVGYREDEGRYPDIHGIPFDRDHQGTGGAMTTDILALLEEVEEDSPMPDIILLGIGGNDLTDGQQTVESTIQNIIEIIDWFQERNNNITIFLEQIAPARSDFMTANLSQILDQFNAEIAALGERQTDNNSRVIVVNMANNWSDTYMADFVHYNEAGAKEVAKRYYNAITNAFVNGRE